MLRRFGVLTLVCFSACSAAEGDLARRQRDADTRWASFENRAGAKGQGGAENRGAKGHAFDSLEAGETKVLMEAHGAGAIRRMWFTLGERTPEMLRSVRLDIYWDGAAEPAVSVPFGDFFGAILGRAVAFENELLSNPEGRSFNCYIPMPFRKGAKLTLTNESGRDIPLLFYDVDYVLTAKPDPDELYFHAVWRRVREPQLGEDFDILPRVRGEGRFLGAHVGVITRPEYTGWWGEGEVKMYIDGDTALPTINGTGTEDYIGTGWGEGVFHNRYQGALVTDEKTGQYTFYRYHVPDPVWFHKDIRVAMQVLGGDTKENVLKMIAKGAQVKPVTVDDHGKLTKLLEPGAPPLEKQPVPAGAWTNIYRRDDWSAVALFYLDAPVNGLPRLAPVAERVAGLESKRQLVSFAPLGLEDTETPGTGQEACPTGPALQ